jgi:hypothetical protein
MEKHMKRFTTVVFAALVALTLSMPVWAQNPPAANSQTKTTEKQTKAEKKQKKDKKAKKQADKDSKKNSTNTSTK